MSLRDNDSPLLLDDAEDNIDYEYESSQKFISRAHDEIECQVAAYLASGGKITEYAPDIRTQKTDALKERSDDQREAQLKLDRQRLATFHKQGMYLHIKYVPKSRINGQGFRVCSNAINLGVRATLDDALLIKTTP